MQIPRKPIRLSERLPATPCTPSMKAEMVRIARNEGISLAYLQRYAFEFFLAKFVSLADKNNQQNRLAKLTAETD